MLQQIEQGLKLALLEDKTISFLWISKKASIFACQCDVCRAFYEYEIYKGGATTRKDKTDALWWLLAFFYRWPAGWESAEKDSHPACARYGGDALGANCLDDDVAESNFADSE